MVESDVELVAEQVIEQLVESDVELVAEQVIEQLVESDVEQVELIVPVIESTPQNIKSNDNIIKKSLDSHNQRKNKKKRR